MALYPETQSLRGIENFDIQTDTNIITERTHMLVRENEWKVGMREIMPIRCHVVIKGLRLVRKVMKSGRS